ncbi:N-acetyltransferase [Candidatus Parvarchaeota archaeon]|nr:N-acetyltransferase [Candidatus Parvarchaeota archaeon]
MAIVNNQSGRMWKTTEHGEADLLYRIDGNVMIIYHTFTPVKDRGHGVAAEIALEAFAYAKKHNLKVKPDCPYILHFIEVHKEYASMLV